MCDGAAVRQHHLQAEAADQLHWPQAADVLVAAKPPLQQLLVRQQKDSAAATRNARRHLEELHLWFGGATAAPGRRIRGVPFNMTKGWFCREEGVNVCVGVRVCTGIASFYLASPGFLSFLLAPPPFAPPPLLSRGSTSLW